MRGWWAPFAIDKGWGRCRTGGLLVADLKDRADEMPSSRPLIAPVLAVPAPTLLFKNSRDAEDCLRGGMRLDLGEL